MSAGAKRAVIVRSGDAGGAAAGAAGAGDSFTGVSPVQAVSDGRNEKNADEAEWRPI